MVKLLSPADGYVFDTHTEVGLSAAMLILKQRILKSVKSTFGE